MSSEITMNVSSMTRNKDEKAIYIQFNDKEKTAEFTLPGCKLISNKGFMPDELEQLKLYIDNEQDSIYKMAKTVNPLRAIMK